MRLLVAIEISESYRKKIAWDLGRYADDLPDETECKDWLDDMIQDKFDELPEASDLTRVAQIIRGVEK